jgi:GNAT superfamily N-acetyltransferase
MIIEKLCTADVEKVATLHHTYMDRGFLTSLGPAFLCQLYSSMIDSKRTFCIVARDAGRVIGFVSGTDHLSEFYKEFLLRKFFLVGLILLPKIVNINNIKKVLETLSYPKKKEKNLPDSELLSIVVEKRYRGQDVSRELFNSLVDEFKSRNICKFKVVVGAELIAACRFYEIMGCIIHSEIEVHEGMKSRAYLWERK